MPPARFVHENQPVWTYVGLYFLFHGARCSAFMHPLFSLAFSKTCMEEKDKLIWTLLVVSSGHLREKAKFERVERGRNGDGLQKVTLTGPGQSRLLGKLET